MIEVIVLALLGAFALIYLYISHIYGYWQRKGLVQPPVKFGFGNIYEAFVMKKNSGLIYSEIYKSYPDHDAVGIYACFTPTLVLRSPELIKKVSVTEFSSFHDNAFTVNEKVDHYFAKDPFVIKGEEWKHSRSKLVSTMTPARMKEIFPLMKNIVPRLHTYINDNLKNDIEAKELATLFTMDIVSDTVFGISSNCFADPKAPFRKFGDLIMKENLQKWWKTMILILLPRIRNLLGLRFVPKAVSEYLEEVVKGVLTYRQNNDVSRNDLFQYVLKKESGNFEELMGFGVTLFLEGFETAAMVASSALYELSLNPQVQLKLFEEVKSMYTEKEDFDYETIMNLPYLENVLQEAQRKYPVIFNFTRVCTKPCQLEIDGKSVEIEPGTLAVVPIFPIQRDPSYYPDPEVFDPERFNEENKATRPAYTFMPFGEGPRICPETQRKYPVLYNSTRICTKPCQLEIDGQLVEIETGTPVVVPIFPIQRDPSYYPDPEVFDPERFNEENKATRPAYTYLPFGEGPRICPGQKYGLIQVKLFIASIVYKYKILKCEKTLPSASLTFSPSSFLVIPNEKLWVRFEKRK